jgi:lysophospholipase L1-like esterase
VNVDLVGSRTKPYAAGGWTGATYADPKFDQNHFAFAGTTLLQQSGWIAQEVRQQHPDLIVVASGVNDMRHGSTPAQTLAHFRAWVTAVRQADPHVDIIVSPVLGAVGDGLPHLAADIVEYDAMLPAEIAQLTSQDSPITLADTTFGWNINAFTVENLHPNPTGETHIAQRIAETMHLLGILPATRRPGLARSGPRSPCATTRRS